MLQLELPPEGAMKAMALFDGNIFTLEDFAFRFLIVFNVIV